jgi:hypothetical protein
MSSELLKYHEIRKQSAIAEAGNPELEKTAFKLTEWSGMKPASSTKKLLRTIRILGSCDRAS